MNPIRVATRHLASPEEDERMADEYVEAVEALLVVVGSVEIASAREISERIEKLSVARDRVIKLRYIARRLTVRPRKP